MGSVDPSLAITVQFGFSCLSMCVNYRGLRQGCLRSSYLVEVCVWTYRNMGITTDMLCCIHVTYEVTSNGSTPWRRGKSSAWRHHILAGISGVGLGQGLLIPIYGRRWRNSVPWETSLNEIWNITNIYAVKSEYFCKYQQYPIAMQY